MTDTLHPTHVMLDADDDRRSTTWPRPDDPTDLAWRLSYGVTTELDRLLAASYLRAYAALCMSEERNQRDTGRVAKRIGRAVRDAPPRDDSRRRTRTP